MSTWWVLGGLVWLHGLMWLASRMERRSAERRAVWLRDQEALLDRILVTVQSLPLTART